MKVYLYCLETKTWDSKFRFFFFEMLLSSPTRVKTARSSPLEFLTRYHHIIVFHRSRSFISAYIVTIRLALSKDSLREEKNNNTVNGDNNRIEKRDRGEKNNKKKKWRRRMRYSKACRREENYVESSEGSSSSIAGIIWIQTCRIDFVLLSLD